MDIFKRGKDESAKYIKKIEETEGLIIVRLGGALDSSTIPLIKKKLEEMHEKYAEINAIADFKKVTHVDTSAIAALVLILSEQAKHGARIGIINAPEELASYLKVSKLESAVKIYGSEKAAIKDLAKKDRAEK